MYLLTVNGNRELIFVITVYKPYRTYIDRYIKHKILLSQTMLDYILFVILSPLFFGYLLIFIFHPLYLKNNFMQVSY